MPVALEFEGVAPNHDTEQKRTMLHLLFAGLQSSHECACEVAWAQVAAMAELCYVLGRTEQAATAHADFKEMIDRMDRAKGGAS